MQCLFILRFASGNTEAVFKMIDGFLNVYSYFISGCPFVCIPDSAWIGTEIFLRINVNHSATGRSSTGIVTMTDTAFGLGFLIVFPFHFGTDKLHRRQTASEMCLASFPAHRKGRIVWTAGSRYLNPLST